MMKQLLPLMALFIFCSCIPLRIAPDIKDDKLMLAKKFKSKLPKEFALIFEDPKDEGEFYYFINDRYELFEQNVQSNVPITIENEIFFMSFYEVEIPTKTINFIPIFLDGILMSNNQDPWFQDLEFSRNGHWYLAITVSDSNKTDCLKPNHHHQKKILNYLRALRIDYLKGV
jgi:hypothetical protein